MQREIKFRIFDGERIRLIDLYWFEEQMITDWPRDNGIQSDNAIMMQFTGLQDKYAVDIYEGDIVFYNSTGYKGEVAYSILAGCGFYVFEDGIDAEAGGRKLLESVADLEVIGNIYENKGLLG